MDGPRDYHAKRSKSERERQIPFNITYMWNLKYNTQTHTRKIKIKKMQNNCTYLQNRNRLKDKENR